MCDSEEEKYWQAFIGGDLDALSVIFTHHVNGLMAYGMRIYAEEELVKDSIQEVFIQLIQKRHQLDLKNNVRGLVYRMLRNRLIDEIKLQNRIREKDQELLRSDVCFEQDAESRYIRIEDESERSLAFSAALDQLSDYQKEALFLKFSNGFSYEQISTVLGINIASVRTLIYRTVKQLRRCISEGGVMPFILLLNNIHLLTPGF